MRKISLDKHAAHYEEFLAWAESYAEESLKAGHGLTWQDIAKKALEDPEFNALEVERQRLYVIARDLVGAVVEENVVHSPDASCPVALLDAMGLGAEADDDPILRKTAMRFKRVLGRLGFGCGPLVRESLKAIVGKISWTTKFCIKYHSFLTCPKGHIGQFLVWLGESFFYAGDAESRGIMPSGAGARANEKGDYKRYGLLGALLVYWVPLQSPHVRKHPDYFARAECDATNWFVKDGHYLRCRKLSATAFVWVAQQQTEKQDAAPKGPEKKAEQHGDTGDRLGTMNYQRFKDWRFVPRLLLFKDCCSALTVRVWRRT